MDSLNLISNRIPSPNNDLIREKSNQLVGDDTQSDYKLNCDTQKLWEKILNDLVNSVANWKSNCNA